MSPDTTDRGTPRLVSVVLPVLNGERHIGDQLAALAAQRHEGEWELVVVDNGCTDRSIEIAEGWRDRLPALRIVDARERRGLNRARNAGADAARGDFLAYCDADDMVAPGWLAALAAAGAEADLVGGRLDDASLNDDVRRAWHPSDPQTGLPSCYAFMPYAPGGNCGVWADVARSVRWDESFRFGASDIDFSWRVQLAGHTVGYAPGAVLRQRHRLTLGATMRQYFRYGLSEPLLFRRYGSVGMLRSSSRARSMWPWFGRRWRLLLSEHGRGQWLKMAASRAGRVCGSLRWRVIYL